MKFVFCFWVVLLTITLIDTPVTARQPQAESTPEIYNVVYPNDLEYECSDWMNALAHEIRWRWHTSSEFKTACVNLKISRSGEILKWHVSNTSMQDESSIQAIPESGPFVTIPEALPAPMYVQLTLTSEKPKIPPCHKSEYESMDRLLKAITAEWGKVAKTKRFSTIDGPTLDVEFVPEGNTCKVSCINSSADASLDQAAISSLQTAVLSVPPIVQDHSRHLILSYSIYKIPCLWETSRIQPRNHCELEICNDAYKMAFPPTELNYRRRGKIYLPFSGSGFFRDYVFFQD